MMTNLAIVGLLLCIVLAYVVKQFPHWLLRIPKYGFAFHHLLTGEPLPAYIRNDCYKGDEFLTWAQPGDAVVSTMAKAGTTWMLYVSHLIRIRGRDDLIPYHEVNTNTPWTQLVHKPGHTWEDTKYLLYNTVLSDGTNLTSKWNHPDYLFRVWKSHEAPFDPESPFHHAAGGGAVMPVRENPDIKFLAMVRDMPDVLASFYPFSKAHVESFRSMWGGFPPDFSSKREMLDLLFGKGGPNSNQDVTNKIGYAFMEYCRLWWKWRKEPNVLLLHFNDAIRDPNGTVAKLATFYGVDLTQEEIERYDKVPCNLLTTSHHVLSSHRILSPHSHTTPHHTTHRILSSHSLSVSQRNLPSKL